MNVTTLVRLAALLSWLRQTSTILGLAGIVGVVLSAITAQMTWAQAVPAIAAGLVAMALPGHPAAESAVRQAAVDAVLAMTEPEQRTKNLAVLIGADLPAAVEALQGAGQTPG